MTNEEMEKIRTAMFRKYLKTRTGEQLSAMREDIDWEKGIRETTGYFLLQGIDIRGVKNAN